MNLSQKNTKKFSLIALLFTVISANTAIFPGFAIAAESAQTISAQSTKEQLEAELRNIEQQIAQYESQLATTRSEKNTLANKIKELRAEQSKLTLQIRQTNLLIDDLDSKIDTTVKTIEVTQSKADRLKAQIRQSLVSLYETDNKGIVAGLNEQEGLAGLFAEIDRTEKLSKNLADALQEAKVVKAELEKQNIALEDQQKDAKDLLAIRALQSQDLNSRLDEQNTLMRQTQGKEAQYTVVLNANKKRASEIRNAIYNLLGVNKQITFGEAVDIAVWVSQQTGVRAAYLLAILTQESNLGKNVGTCNRPNDPPEKGWRVIMKPTRDQEPFVSVTTDLGLDTDTTPVSCPMKDSKGNQVGWGGAMGPAQFIPSTWVGYRGRIEAITGKTANPWDIKDAFIAAALLLKANGATSGGEDGEWKAAMRYFSGSTNTRFRFYGDNVLKLARNYQSNIDALN